MTHTACTRTGVCEKESYRCCDISLRSCTSEHLYNKEPCFLHIAESCTKKFFEFIYFRPLKQAMKSIFKLIASLASSSSPTVPRIESWDNNLWNEVLKTVEMYELKQLILSPNFISMCNAGARDREFSNESIL